MLGNEDVLNRENLPPFHPNCVCYVEEIGATSKVIWREYEKNISL